MRLLLAVSALLAAASPASAKLELVNIRPAYGRLGPERTDLKVLPYDQVFFRYDIVGLKSNNNGEAEISTTVVIIDPGSTATTAEPVKAKVSMPLGGDRVPSFATVFLTEQRPGKYEIEVRVTDMVTGEGANFSRAVELRPPEFGVTSLNFSHDPEGHVPAPGGGLVGHVLFARFLVVGFDKSKIKVDVDVSTRVLTEDGKPAAIKPMVNQFRTTKPSEVKDARFVTVVNPILLHRPGRFILEITVGDRVTNKIATLKVPIVVTTVDPEPASPGKP